MNEYEKFEFISLNWVWVSDVISFSTKSSQNKLQDSVGNCLEGKLENFEWLIFNCKQDMVLFFILSQRETSFKSVGGALFYSF